MRHLLIMFLLASASFAAAEEFTIDESVVTACFARLADGQAINCIGDAANTCQQTTKQGQTTLGISQCLMAENAAWDVLLNREYKAVRDSFASQPELQQALLTAQRAWIALRDADCTLAYDRWGNGSMRQIGGASCQMNHTARRALDLKQMREF